MPRKTFIQDVSVDSSNKFLFSAIPERGIVRRVGDPGILLYQKIGCRAKANDLLDVIRRIEACAKLCTSAAAPKQLPCAIVKLGMDILQQAK